MRGGDIIYELVEPPAGKNLQIGIIVFSGLPNQPRNEDFGDDLAAEGFYVLQPRYIGNWESYGQFTLGNCIKTVLDSETFFLKGNAKELWAQKGIHWRINTIFLLSSSFGSSVVLSALPKIKSKNIICLCPLTNLNKHHSDSSIKEQDLSTLGGFIQRGFENAFRGFNQKEWAQFIQGNSEVNPIRHAAKVIGKNILLIHGTEDDTVNISRTEEYYQKIKNKNKTLFKKYPGIGHGKKLRTASYDFILKWIKETKSTF